METQKTQTAKAILRKKNEAEGISLPDFRLYYKLAFTKTEWPWHKPEIYINRVRIESPEINPHTYGQLSYDIKGKHVHWRKKSLQ